MNAQEMSALADSKSQEIIKIYDRIDKQIKSAAEKGRHYTYFDFYGNNILTYEQAQDHYRKLGFSFHHIGVINGVMKAPDCQNIGW